MRNPLIRPYKSDDFEIVTFFWRRANEQAFSDFKLTWEHTFEEDRDYFRNVILEKHDVWVAVINGKPVACMAISDDFISHLHVDPDYQRRGIGTALLDHAKSLSPKFLRLYTLQVNIKAGRFYEKNGFRAVKFGISPPPESEPDVEYHWNAME